ncbi:MAG TPA: alpha/beta fold hydrolase [Mycobacteriales bacterium]|nr:alpha/beta fold hydrolase [Mycobacteriales bacterium]
MRDVLVRAGAATGRGIRTVCSPTGIRGTAVEFAWTAAHLATYPLGVARERASEATRSDLYTLAGLPPVQRGLLLGDVEAAGTPILLIHGIMDNRSVFTLLQRGLSRRGFGRVRTLNYQVFTHDIRSAARRLAAEVEQLAVDSGHERIHVIGHSLGGLIARYYVQRLGGDERVHTVVTLGSPHAGTQLARLAPGRLLRQLRPDSDVIAELAEPAPGCRTRFVAFWTDLDGVILPKHSARIDHPDLAARNIFVRGVGHLSMPIHRQVIHEICSTLAHLDSDGGLRTAGVTNISSSPTPGPSRLRRLTRPARRADSAG